MEAPVIARYLGKLAALEALAQFAGKNICSDDVSPIYSACLRDTVLAVSDDVLSDIVAGADPHMHNLEDSDFQKDQLEYFSTSWDGANEITRKAILAWYILREEAHNSVEKIRGHVPASWDDVNW